ncbi:HD-GYP domain-containing protein [Aquitalea magnusonii]|uniref:HD-GYP domain-containing protein (C-di-GMP phosphodiesterase class II) n=1 Tax=Aquitalea magnusonii TaxID=332411 RepID=A0A318JPJ3_9NEIS|nr:HD domain-containing phosphohydrolase [Aquitalea magnusonii]PXX46030.1 HD-GYP domain-containing protein (c-di-GMP phosphodiesterase class II) [Aquitalea magnusonii]
MVKLLRRASLSDLPVNKPLEWSIYDANNNLILRKGIVISMPGVAEKIVHRGYYIGEPNPAEEKSNEAANEDERDEWAVREPVFVLATELITSISRIHKIVLSPPSNLSRIEDLVWQRARQLIQLLKRNSDAVLAALYLNQSSRETRPVKHVLGAAVAYLIAVQSCDDDAQLLPLVCAALTRDISLYHFDHTSSHLEIMSDHEYSRIKEHTVSAVRMLRKHGIHNEAWLRYVYEHHEKPDGSGYPHGKKNDELHEFSMILSLADTYAGMVVANQRRSGILPGNSLKEIFVSKGSLCLEKHISVLIRKIGIFPPGSLVQLNNGEVGIVKSYCQNKKNPEVYVVSDAKGFPKADPVLRDIRQPEFAIQSSISLGKCKVAMFSIKKIWQEV